MKRYFYSGDWYTVKQIAAMTDVDYKLLLQRLYNGYDVDMAVSENPLKPSVKHFFDSSSWEDWTDQTTDHVYTVYWQWCIKENHDPVSKVSFIKSVRKSFPWLKVVVYNGKRVIRED